MWGKGKKCLVNNSQYKGLINNKRMKISYQNDVYMQLNILSLCYELRPSQRLLFTAILKRSKESAEKQQTKCNLIAYTKIPQDLNDVKT